MAAVAATMTDPSTNSNSPRSPGKQHRTPWAQVVRGAGDSVPVPNSPEKAAEKSVPVSEVSDKGNGNGTGGNVGKKPAWNKPGNGVSSSGSGGGGGDQGGVMGAALWPALSESARVLSQKADSPKASAPESSVPASQGTGTSHSQHLKQVNATANTNHNSSTNATAPTRQKSMKRGGENKQGSFTRGPPPPPPLPEGVPVAVPDQSLRGPRPSGGVGSQSNPANEHSHQRSSNRRGNFGSHGRGDGRNSYHGGRRDQDQGNQEWHSSQTSNGRGAHVHPHRGGGGVRGGFVGHAVQGPAPVPFVAPTPMGPYGYPDVAPPYYYMYPVSAPGLPFGTAAQLPPFVVDPHRIMGDVLKQIDYYFSEDNLVKDEYLKSKMDDQGWVPISLIANFRRVKVLNVNIQFILQSLRASTVVEVQGDKVRRRDDWRKWIIPTQSPSDSCIQSGDDNVATSLQNVSLEEVNHDFTAVRTQSNSTNVSTQTLKELTGERPVTNMEGSAQNVC